MKKFFLLILLVVCLTFLSAMLPDLVHAQAQSVSAQNSNFSNLDANVPANLHTYTQSVVIDMLSSFSCILTGIDPAHPKTPCLGVDTKTDKLGYVQQPNGGLVGMMGGAIAMTFNIPASTHDYVAYAVSDFGFAKKTYAAGPATGSGFSGLSPLLGIWRTFRNVVYILFTIIFVIIGLGIVLRIPMDNRTVMTIQNQIPRAVMVLVLVTLSFAIVGIMIDFMYVIIYMIYALFASIPQMGVPSLNPSSAFGHTPFEAVNGITGLAGIAQNASGVIGGLLGSVFSGTMGRWIVALVMGILGQQIGASTLGSLPFVGSILGGILGAGAGAAAGYFLSSQIVSFVGSLIAFVIIALAIIVALVRLWYILIKAYLFILIDTIFAPFWIGAGLIPHSPMGFGSWFKHLLSNLLVFPFTFVFFMLAYVFLRVFTVQKASNYFVPPFVGNLGDYHILGPVLAFAIILLTSEIPNMIKGIVKTPDLKYDQAIGKGLSLGVSTGQTFAKPFKEKLWSYDEHGNPHGKLNELLANRPFIRNRLILRNLVGGKPPQSPDAAEQARDERNLSRTQKLKRSIHRGSPNWIQNRWNVNGNNDGDDEDNEAGGNQGGGNPPNNPPPAGGGPTPGGHFAAQTPSANTTSSNSSQANLHGAGIPRVNPLQHNPITSNPAGDADENNI